MEDAVSPRGTMLETTSDAAVDVDLMEDLLSGRCWLETTQYPGLFQQGTSSSAPLLDCSYFSLSEINGSSSNPNPTQDIEQDDQRRPIFPHNPSSSIEALTDSLIGTQSLSRVLSESGQLESYPVDGSQSLVDYENRRQSSEVSRRWWIEPRANPDPVSSVKERLVQVLESIMESTKGSNVLVQIWVPIKRGGRHVLTTYDQPFSLDPSCQRLVNYRTASVKYQFPAEEDSIEPVGLPGRVFLARLPEWTPDVQYFSSDEYPRIDHALRNDVRGTLALPVFERCSRVCLGVVEFVLTTQKINYRPELESICNALKAVNLRSSEVVSVPRLKVSSTFQVVLPEISHVLRAACETHRLPLAQTWVPCMQQGKKGSRHSDENYAICVSTVDVACYVTCPHVYGFHEACSEHHLFRGQGVAGEAFTTNQPCFSPDITSFSKTQYPLSHYAKMFGLRAAVAIRLRSIYTGTIDYVLEFFLPTECQDSEEQKMMLNSLSMIIQQVCESLRVVTDKELGDESVFPINEEVPSVEALMGPSGGGDDGRRSRENNPAEGKRPKIAEAEWKGKSPVLDTLPSECQEATDGFSVRNPWYCPVPEGSIGAGQMFPELKQHHQDLVKDDVIHGDFSFSEGITSIAGKATEKRRTKTEKNISLQVLRQYFAGSLKDAAKSIGVCPTTLKRICRQHGITRWPSRKIKKVGRSLKKLQAVINSVHGVDGAFQLSSLYADFPHVYDSGLTSPKPSINSTLSRLKQTTGLPTSSDMQPEDVLGVHVAPAQSPSSGCSQSSSSSLYCSTGLQQRTHACQLVVSDDASMAENKSGVLKRAYSEAELHAFTKDEKKPPRSLSHLSLVEHPSLERSLSYLRKGSSHICTDGSSLKVKVIHRDEKIRFRMQASWGFHDLLREVAKRFNIDDASTFNLKYLDDDSEWVLLTCDDDLQECKDIYKSAHGHVIKLSVHHVAHPTTKNSLRL